MVCILSAFNGIEDLVKDLFGTLDADLALVPQSGAVISESWGEFLTDVPGVEQWAPVLEDEVVVRAGRGGGQLAAAVEPLVVGEAPQHVPARAEVAEGQ